MKPQQKAMVSDSTASMAILPKGSQAKGSAFPSFKGSGELGWTGAGASVLAFCTHKKKAA